MTSTFAPTPHRPPLLEARDLRVSFARRAPVLDGASLTIAAGTVSAVVGENGSGKSTLLRVLAGLLQPDGGDVRVTGRVGYCPQDPELFQLLTVREHLALFSGALGLPDVPAARERLVRRLALDRHADTLVRDASGGTRQKLNLALALLGDPAVLLLDEPYAAFDWQTYLVFWELAAELRDRGKAILVVAHLVDDRVPLDRRWTLARGVLACA